MSELKDVFESIVRCTDPTESSHTLKEIHENKRIIEERQVVELLQVHDKVFYDKCVRPVNKLKKLYDALLRDDTDIQTHVALTDRDLRIIEATLDMAYQNSK